jgi:hypothetical protein
MFYLSVPFRLPTHQKSIVPCPFSVYRFFYLLNLLSDCNMANLCHTNKARLVLYLKTLRNFYISRFKYIPNLKTFQE